MPRPFPMQDRSAKVQQFIELSFLLKKRPTPENWHKFNELKKGFEEGGQIVAADNPERCYIRLTGGEPAFVDENGKEIALWYKFGNVCELFFWKMDQKIDLVSPKRIAASAR